MIETSELILRHTNKEDRDDFVGLVTLPAYGRLSPFGPLSVESAEKVLATIIENYEKNTPSHEFFSVINKKMNDYAGFIGYQPLVFEGTTDEMIFLSFQRKFWGSNLPLLATKTFCREIFKQKNQNRFIAFVHPEDVESLHIAQALGGHFERECQFFDTTVLLFSLTRDQLASAENQVSI